MRFYLLSLLLLLSIAYTPSKAQSNGILQYDKETYDFGDIIEGILATHEFTFTNTGMDTVVLKSVKASCGCTTPSWTKDPIAPGEKGKITATFNSANRKGAFRKSIMVTSNSSEPTKMLYIKGTVISAPKEVPDIEKTPSMLSNP